MNTLDRLSSLLEEVESVNARLNESLSPTDKRSINDIIHKKKNGDFIFNGTDVNVTSKNNMIQFSYDGVKADSLTFALTDICDSQGLEFKYGAKDKKHTFTVIL